MTDKLQYLRIHMDLADMLGKYYINSTPVFRLGDLDISVHDAAAAAILSGTATYLIGTRGSGKTLLGEAIWRAVMNGEGLYLRGDKDLTLKDLYLDLNLDGKTNEEIYKIAVDRIRHIFTFVDELNRCIGLVQNQFLNIGDGYIEIRGKKYFLGKPDQNYSLMVATGNPATDGEYTGVFDEDVALLDRIGLILNVNDFPLTEDDIATIKERGITKSKIQTSDMQSDVLRGNRTLTDFSGSMVHYLSILAAYIDRRFRIFESGGKQYDKTQVEDWRSLLQQGSHAKGDKIAFASDISTRAQQENKLAEALLLFYICFKNEEAKSKKPTSDAIEAVPSEMVLDCYLETLMLNLRYDRRFLPFDHIIEAHHGDAKEYLDAVKSSLKNEINHETLEECAGICSAATDALDKGKPEVLQDYKDYLDAEHASDPIARTTKRILEQRQKKKLNKDRRGKVRDSLKRKLKAK
jgi:MoxR-like ATPase